MCGIVGFVGARAAVTRQRLVRMRDTLRHRGPDDAGVWYHAADDVAVGLGHRRLSIIDTRELGRQPMTNEDGSVRVVFNGEIYGFQALRADLLARGHTFATRTDTEVLVHLYEERGPDMVSDLDGMFAFALWDARRRRLVLARDRMGIKPLFVADGRATAGQSGALYFASELKAILASRDIDDAIDHQAAHDFLGLTYTPGPRTMLRGARKLPPGHVLVWEDGRATTRRYWRQRFHTVRDPRRANGSGTPTLAEAADEVLTRLRRSVQRRMISDVPLGMFLSGGIDSSAVLACMSEVSDRPVKAFTISFEEAGYDESDYARVAAQTFGAEHHVETVRPDPDTFMGPLVESFDEPYADSSAIPLWYLCRLARQHVTVALGGDGGDELYAGYRTHRAWRAANLYRRLPKTLRDRLIPAAVERLPVSHGKVSFDLKARQFVAAAAGAPAAAHCGFKTFLSEDARDALRTADAAALEPSVRLFEAAFGAAPFGDGLEAVLHSDFELYLPDDILVKVDRMSMAHSLEARVPFLDHELVEHAAGLPGWHKLFGFRTKHVLKRALRGRVPWRILERPKAGFNVPMARWLCEDLRTLARDTLAPSRVRTVGLWSPEEVTRMLDAHESRERDLSRPIWSMLVFMLWNDRHRGGRPA